MVCLANSFAVLFLVLIVSVSGCKVLCLLGTHAVFVTRHGSGIVTRFVGMLGARLSASPYCLTQFSFLPFSCVRQVSSPRHK
jgi:hypothetical protein